MAIFLYEKFLYIRRGYLSKTKGDIIMAINGDYDALKYMGSHSTADYPRYKKIADSAAAKIFGQLDRSDGEDGFVTAEKWNEYALANGGNTIPEGHVIDIWNGINSITTYEVRKAQELEKLQKATVKPDENGQLLVYDEKGKVLDVKGVRELSHGYIIYGKSGIQVQIGN